MCSLDQGWVSSPTSRFEGGRVQEAVVEGEKALSDAIGDLI